MEILLVVGIISILAGIVIVAINPSKQLATVRNTERKSDIKQIDSAITQYYIDNFHYPTGITGTLTGICNTGSGASTTEAVGGGSCSGLINLSKLVPDYITAIPTDPQASTTNTGYYVKEDSTTHKLGVQANLAELDTDIVIGMTATGTTPGEEEPSTLGDGLVAHYLMNDTDGTTVVDTQGNDGTGTYIATDGVVGGALSFDGGSNYINIPYDSSIGVSSQPFSISMWVYVNDTNNFQAYLTQEGDGTGFSLYGNAYNGNQLVLYLGDGANNAYSGLYLSASEWHYIGYSYDENGNYRSWIDDNIVTPTGDGGNPVINNGLDYYLGYSDYGYWLNGKLDDVRIYNRALTTEEIGQIYNEGDGTEAE